MSFKAVQNKIEGEGYSKRAAGAILAHSTRNASPAAKRANPKLNRVKGGPDPKPKRTMRIEEADNGGFITRTTHEMPHKPGQPWQEPVETKNVHGSTHSLMQHVRHTFPPKAAGRAKAAAQPQWAGVANAMLGNS